MMVSSNAYFRMVAQTLFACLLSLLLIGCATMSKDECRHADWHLKGFDDASKGEPLNLVEQHRKACARVNVTPNVQEYREGHGKGARLYCVPEKGYTEGRRGAAYNGICPVELENNFLRAYRDGQEFFAIERNMNNMLNTASEKRSRIDSIYDQVDQLKRDIVNSNDVNERNRKMNEVDSLQNDISRLEVEIDRATHEAELFRRDLQFVEQKHMRMGYVF